MSIRVCIITGAGQGIGRALALHFAERGLRIAIAEQNATSAAEVANEIASRGGQARGIATDVTDPASVRAMVAQVQHTFGRVDILINNARWTGLAPTRIQDISDADWRRALDVNVTGAFNCARAVVPTMIAAKWGRIINMSSATVRAPPARPYVHYITSKAALVGMTRALAKELGAFGITVNAILPGSIETGIARPNPVTSAERDARAKAAQAIPRRLTSGDLAGTAYFLASDDSAFVTGQSIAVDGGLTFG
jgi:NAD(P)-dependent dehydrogenase (short-subunit alcohol dehydrogenase family)